MPYADPARQRQAVAEQKRRRTERIRELKQGPCADCGGSFHPAAMQFDHRPGEGKFAKLSKMQNYAWDRVLAEIAKCDLVCANCHAVRTYERTLS